MFDVGCSALGALYQRLANAPAPNAGGRRLLTIRMPLAARVGELGRWARRVRARGDAQAPSRA